jgi:hypothetical protein
MERISTDNLLVLPSLYQRLLLQNLFVRNLRIFVIRLSVCPWQAFLAYCNKHFFLVRKLVIYGQKSFITLPPALLY